jgi:hypothetical protein
VRTFFDNGKGSFTKLHLRRGKVNTRDVRNEVRITAILHGSGRIPVGNNALRHINLAKYPPEADAAFVTMNHDRLTWIDLNVPAFQACKDH